MEMEMIELISEWMLPVFVVLMLIGIGTNSWSKGR
jgi:hypothetical protein